MQTFSLALHPDNRLGPRMLAQDLVLQLSHLLLECFLAVVTEIVPEIVLVHY